MAMSDDMLLTIKREILDLADIFAQAVVKHMTPGKDEMTRRQAREEFGANWLKRQEENGRIKGRRVGKYETSPIMYSRAELMALREAEKRECIHMVRRTK